MEKLSILLSSEAKAAYFSSTLEVAKEEFRVHFPETSVEVEHFGKMTFLNFELPLDNEILRKLSRLSFAHGVFVKKGPSLTPLNSELDFYLPA